MDTDLIRFSLYVCLYLLIGFAITWWAHNFLIKNKPDSGHLKYSPNVQVFALFIITVIWPVLVGSMIASFITSLRKVFGKFYVRIEWNTDADGYWYDRNIEQPEGSEPCTLHGPFRGLHTAEEFMIAWPDGDKDVYDMYTVRRKDFSRKDYVNDPADVHWWQPR